MTKYSALGLWLEQQRGLGVSTVRLSFKEVEQRIRGVLPSSAYQRDLWWKARGRDSGTHALHGWLRVGWIVREVDVQKQAVRFRDVDPTMAVLYRHGCDARAPQVAL